MRAVRRLLFLLLAAVAAFPVPLAAEEEGPEEEAAGEREPTPYDRVHLTNGNVMVGHVLREDEESVTLSLPSDVGGSGIMILRRERIARIDRGSERRLGPTAPVRDAWFLLRSGGEILGVRRLLLRHVPDGDLRGWRLDEEVRHFARGPHVPATRIDRSESVDLAFFPRRFGYREVGEGARGSDGPRRYERSLSGSVTDGLWQAVIHEDGTSRRHAFAVPEGVRGRLGAREHLLRERTTGIRSVSFLDTATGEVVHVRAGYTALDARTEAGAPYDEFVWEENGVRLVSRFHEAEALEEWVADGVVAIAVSRAQAEAAEAETLNRGQPDDPLLVRLPEIGLSFRMPDSTWHHIRPEVLPTVTGWRKVALLESDFHLGDVRIEWHPEAAREEPDPEQAAAHLMQRLRSVCPDLVILEPRRSLEGEWSAWRMELRGTLKGEVVRTLIAVVDRGDGRALFLAACPDVTWTQTQRAFEGLIASLEPL